METDAEADLAGNCWIPALVPFEGDGASLLAPASWKRDRLIDNRSMNWEQICADPNLRDLPFKIETNQRGQIVMSPARSRHGEYQSEIVILFRQLLPQGRSMVECPVQTSAGVRVPDVAWASPERRQPVIYHLAPEICVEVLSPYNDIAEMDEERALYFEAGAVEAWICAENGVMSFYAPSGKLTASAFCPSFPARVDI